MSEQESLLLDVGNMVGVIAIIVGLFVIATLGTIVFNEVTKLNK
jgi:hypothetical protein